MRIDIQSFIGRIPLAADHLLPNNAATVAKNCQIRRGLVEPVKDITQVATPSKAGNVTSIYKFGNFWFNWLNTVHAVKGPVPGDTMSRTYYTGDGVPKMTDASIATSGSDYPTAAYVLGIPAPTSAATIALNGTPNPDPADANTEESRRYVYTYVSAYGEEGPASDPSSEVTWAPGQTVDVTMLGAPPGNYNITKKRIYRTVTTSDGTSFYLVDEIAVGTTAYNDAIDTSALATTYATATFDPPPDDLFNLLSMPGGILVGFTKNRICFSEPYQPHAWPVGYRLTVDADIVGGGVFGNSVLIVTKDNTYVAYGDSPDAMSLERLEISQSCVSGRGVADMGDGVIYPSPDGLILVGTGGVNNLTKSLLTRDQWQAYSPDTLIGLAHDGRYYGFYDTGTTQAGFIFDIPTGSWVDIDLYANGGYADPETDTLYLLVNGEIVSFGTGDNLTATWRSKEIITAAPVHVGLGQVIAEDYPVTFTLDIDGKSGNPIYAMDSRPFFLPPGVLGRRFAVQVVSNHAVEKISLAQNMSELR